MSWEAVADAAEYQLRSRGHEDPWIEYEWQATTSATFPHTEGRFEFQVRARGAGGASPWSDSSGFPSVVVVDPVDAFGAPHTISTPGCPF